ncbi:MAG TPA: hypothetical protein PKL31_14785 [Fulvivirga sp.]|nr:hypothetical protein [Fulvivirga sp.]
MKQITTLLFIFILSNGYAQLSNYNYADDGKMVKFEPRYISVKTLEADPDSVKNPNGFTIRLFSLDKVNFDQGGYQYSHRFAFITESLSGFLIDMINGGNFETGFKNSSTSLSDFIIGWHNHVVNVVSLDNFNVAIGGHWGDYFLAFEPYSESSNTFEVVNEPAGWYGALGPAIMLDFNVFNVVNLHFEGSYAFTAKFMDATDMNFDREYPKPHFINLNLQLRTNSPIYAGFEQIRSVNRGDHPFNATRSDIFIGIWL